MAADKEDTLYLDVPAGRVVIEDCGHMAPMERPVELGAILGDWIRREAL